MCDNIQVDERQYLKRKTNSTTKPRGTTQNHQGYYCLKPGHFVKDI